MVRPSAARARLKFAVPLHPSIRIVLALPLRFSFSLSALIPMKISVKQAYKTPRQKSERRQPKKAEAKKVGGEEREGQEESARRGTESAGERTAEATTGVSTIVLKTPGWNSKDVAESLSPSLPPSLLRVEERISLETRLVRARTSEPPSLRRPNPLMLLAELTTLLSLQKQNLVFIALCRAAPPSLSRGGFMSECSLRDHDR